MGRNPEYLAGSTIVLEHPPVARSAATVTAIKFERMVKPPWKNLNFRLQLPGKQDAKCGKENRTPRLRSRYKAEGQGDPRWGDRLKRSWRHAEFQSTSQTIQRHAPDHDCSQKAGSSCTLNPRAADTLPTLLSRN
ncbi:hypothetical protein Pres01_24730 [Metapseudomonas resinovorans]|nr:hypothetical protein Pres01_24730 [Pseudomonas resinovorans]